MEMLGRSGVERPVPVGLQAFPAALVEGFLPGVEEKAVEGVEDALERGQRVSGWGEIETPRRHVLRNGPLASG